MRVTFLDLSATNQYVASAIFVYTIKLAYTVPLQIHTLALRLLKLLWLSS